MYTDAHANADKCKTWSVYREPFELHEIFGSGQMFDTTRMREHAPLKTYFSHLRLNRFFFPVCFVYISNKFDGFKTLTITANKLRKRKII
jgi:hypothetical protein